MRGKITWTSLNLKKNTKLLFCKKSVKIKGYTRKWEKILTNHIYDTLPLKNIQIFSISTERTPIFMLSNT